MPDGIYTPDLCVIGAGSAGLSLAAGAAQMGAETLLVEQGAMGGDCLNYGCVPSKALLAAAKIAKTPRYSSAFGVDLEPARVNFQRLHDHIHEVIAAIAPNDSVERFAGLGVRVISASAKFSAANEVIAGTSRIRARRFVIATGSEAAIPPIPGLDQVPFLTNTSIFNLTSCPQSLIVIGGGPIGCELGQAFCRLGAQVTLLQRSRILPKDDPDLVAVVRQSLKDDGLDLHEGVKIKAVAQEDKDQISVEITSKASGHSRRFVASHLLICAGRQPAIAQLNLAAAGVTCTAKGIAVNQRLRSSNPRIYAAGDVIGGHQFTHVAGYHAGILMRNILFRLPAQVQTHAIPWVTYSDPELATVGLSAQEGAQRGMKTLTWEYQDNDRAQTERRTRGLVQIIVDKRGRVRGGAVVGAQAGEVIQPLILATWKRLKVAALATVITPYPTYGEVIKRAAGSYYTPNLFSPRTRRLVRWLRCLGS